MRLIDYFQHGRRLGGGGVALVDGERRMSWAQLEEAVEKLASAMAASGLSAGARVGVYSPNDASAFCVVLATLRLGGVWIPVNARGSQEANQRWLELSGCQALFYHSSLEDQALDAAGALRGPAVVICLDRAGQGGARSLAAFLARAGRPAPEPDDAPDSLATLFPTGGTTGLAKAARWTPRIWEALMGAFWRCMPSVAPPVHLVAAPMTHAAGVLALCAMAGGGTNVLLSKVSPELILDAIEQHRISHLYLPPTLVYALLDHPGVRARDFSSLRYLLIAASPIAPARLREAMDVFGPAVCQCYGQAEAPMFLTFLSSRDLREGPQGRWASCGRGALAARVEIMGPDGALLGAGERGEIVARGSLVIAGYHDNPEADSAALTDGWRRTGDIGYRDDEGFVYIVDRAKDMIVSGGFNVFSAEVEQVILEHPAVLNCAVIGVPDPKWGEAVKAVVELKEGASFDPAELTALVRARLDAVHAPKSVEIWDALPRSPAGKVMKAEIRERFWRDHDRRVG